MKCDDCLSELWQYADGEVAGELCLDIETHLASCHACSGELESINAIKTAMNALPKGLDIDGARRRVLAKVLEPAGGSAIKIRFQKPKPRLVTWFAGAGLAAAMVVAAVIGFLPSSTAAISLDDLLMWHVQCLKDGRDKNYTCKTQMELDKKILRNMGMQPHPFDMSHHSGFVKGDICVINGSMASHAIFELNGEKIISHFHVKDYDGRIKNYRGVKKLKEGLFSLSAKDHQILVRELEPGYFEVYIAKTPIENLLRFVETEKFN